MQGMIFDIKKFALHDGPGIRSTVFLKGCPLRCSWCHNPESQASEPELLFSPEKCLACGWCVDSCPEHCHSFAQGRHHFDRTTCRHCGLCATRCFSQALEFVGSYMSVEEVLQEVCKDSIFYANSGGGMTVSGGEPLAQFAFVRELLTQAKNRELHNCLETCGYASWKQLAALVEVVDLFLYDLKSLDSAQHTKITTKDNHLILENLRRLDAAGARIILRCPIIPGINDSTKALQAIGSLADELVNVQKLEIEPYNPLGLSKYSRLGRTAGFVDTFIPAEKIAHYLEIIRAATSHPVQIA